MGLLRSRGFWTGLSAIVGAIAVQVDAAGSLDGVNWNEVLGVAVPVILGWFGVTVYRDVRKQPTSHARATSDRQAFARLLKLATERGNGANKPKTPE